MKKVLLLLADGFEEIEALGTADILRRMNVEVVLASMKKAAVSGRGSSGVDRCFGGAQG